MNKKREVSFAHGVVFMTASAIAVKLIGICYKIPLVRLLGTQGMGYFNAAYDVYALLCMISTTGLPVAVSVMMNKYKGQHKRIFLLSLCVFMVVGLIASVGVFVFADRIAILIGAPEAAQSLRFIAPAVLFVCLSGALRGYYQGKRNMTPTAVSQVIEAVGKLVFGLIFAEIAINKQQGPISAAAFAVLGLSVGTLLCFVYLCMCNKRAMRIDHEHAIGSQHMLAQLMAIAFPITLGAAVSGLAKMIDLGLIMRRLQDAGMDHNSAVSLYGCYSAMVAPLYHAVPALFGSITMPLIPHLSHAIANHDRKEQAELLDTTFRLTATISIPASFGMGLLCEQILRLLYGNTTEIMTAIPLLLVMSMAIPAACLITSTSAILQAYGHAWIPMISTLIGCALKAGVLYALAGMPSIGIMSAPISTLVCCSVIVLINMVCISKIVPEDSFSKPWVGAAAASLVSIGVAALVKRMMMEKCDSLIMIVIVTMASAISLYAILAFKFGLLRISDIKPKEKKEQQNNGNSRKDSKSSVQEGIQL